MFAIGSQINETRTDGSLVLLRKDLDYFKHIGLTAAEIPPHGLDVIRNGNLDGNRLEAIKEILAEQDFLYTVHAPNPLNLMERHDLAMHLDVFRSSLAFAGEIGAPFLAYHAGRVVPEEAFHLYRGAEGDINLERDLLDQEAELLGILADEFPDVTIGIENARPYLGDSPYCYGERLDQLSARVRQINRPNIGITLDCGHLFMASQHLSYNAVRALREAAPLVRHCHIHDNYGHACYYNEKQQTHLIPFGKGDSHMPVGWGTAPLKAYLEALLPYYKGCFIMELRPRYFSRTGESLRNLTSLLETCLNEDEGQGASMTPPSSLAG